jgi:hypothetical protein
MTPPALAPVLDLLMRTARANAVKAVAAAEADSSDRLERSRAEAAALLAKARADGEAAAERASAVAVGAARREGRETTLAAHRRAYEALRLGIREALADRVESTEGAALLSRLEALARGRLGPNASVLRLDDGRIGVSGTDGKRSLELTVDRLVERELAALGDRVEGLWQ